MAKIYVARKELFNDPTVLDEPGEHSYLVFDPDDDPTSGNERIIRGGSVRVEGDDRYLLEVDRLITESRDSLDDIPGTNHDVYTDRYYTTLTSGTLNDVQAVWDNMIDAAKDIAVQGTDPWTVDDEGNPTRVPEDTDAWFLAESLYTLVSENCNCLTNTVMQAGSFNLVDNPPEINGDQGTGETQANLGLQYIGRDHFFVSTGDDTVDLGAGDNTSYFDQGGADIYQYDYATYGDPENTINIYEDANTSTADRLEISGVDEQYVFFERTPGGDLHIFIDPPGAGGSLTKPAFIIKDQFDETGAPKMNSVWIHPPGGGGPSVLPLNNPDDIPRIRSAPHADWIDDPQGPWDDSPNQLSPLVLDLNADTVQLTAFDAATTTTYFDLFGDGFARQTAWVDSNDGLLARDINQNGQIDDITELFGSGSVDGFALLADLDSNGDSLIDQHDSAWNEIVVWKDVNSDAVTQIGELHTMASLDIVSIDLAGVVESATPFINGNPISHESTFKYGNGTTGSIVDAWFIHDTVNTLNLSDDSNRLETDYLPNLRGVGTLSNLDIAMSQDSSLLVSVWDLATTYWDSESFQSAATLNTDITNILYKWAGVDGVDPTSRGGSVDAQHLEFLEEFFGEEFVHVHQTTGAPTGGPFPQPGAGETLESVWDVVFGNLKAQLLVQIGAGDIFNTSPTYDLAAGEITGTMDLSQTAVDDLETAASEIGVDTLAFWKGVANLVEFTKGIANLTSPEITMLDDAIVASDPTLSWEFVATGIQPAVAGETWFGTSNDDTYTSTLNDDTLFGNDGEDELHGGAGHDIINGDNGNDELFGDDGSDTLNGGAGINIIHGGNGHDTVNSAFGSTNTINGDAGEDLLNGADGNDIISGGADNDELHGADGMDVLSGDAGNDELYGGNHDDTLKPGQGGDVAEGGFGDDTYEYEGGDDVYYEATNAGTDIITLPTGVALADLDFFRLSSDGLHNLRIHVDDIGTIDIKDFFDTGSGNLKGTIETIEFADLTTYDLDAFTDMTSYGDDTDNFFDGVFTTAEINDTMYGLEGDDTLWGRAGTDILDGGQGNDSLDGGTGDDIFIFSPGFDTISDGGGNDTINIPVGYTADDLSVFKDGTGDAKLLVDGLGQVIITGQFSASPVPIEQIYFEDDQSTLLFSDISVEQRGDDGVNDSLTGLASGASPDDILDGRGGNDTLTGDTGTANGNDTYVFSEGEDTVYETGSTAADKVLFRDGWTPSDVYVYRQESVGFGWDDLVIGDQADQSGNKLTVESHFDGVGTQIETVEFSDGTVWDLTTMNIQAWGTTGNDSISIAEPGGWTYRPFAGNDYMSGFTGNDTFIYSAGHDSIDEAGGNDTLHITGGVTINNISVFDVPTTLHTQIDVNPGTDDITINFFRQTASDEIETILFDDGFYADLPSYNSWIKGDGNNNTLTSGAAGEVLIGYAGDDTITGNDGDDHAHGGAGIDNIDGGNGADLLYGGTENDILTGGAGNDTLNGGSGDDSLDGGAGTSDTVDYSDAAFGVTVDLINFEATGQDIGTDSVINIENVIGSEFDDTIIGNNVANIFDGLGGNDTLYGSGANDIILGGEGDDVIQGNYGIDIVNGGNGIDTMSYSLSLLGVTVDLVAGTGTGEGLDFISNIENATGSWTVDTLAGDSGDNILSGIGGNDTLWGRAGNDTLLGGNGNDSMDGGLGADNLYGGGGTDKFFFFAASAFDALDTINDFNYSFENDAIDISDVLDGSYTFGTDVITDFVQFTDNGTDSTLAIDQDGGADNFVAVASILGVTGLDAVALESSGHLITV